MSERKTVTTLFQTCALSLSLALVSVLFLFLSNFRSNSAESHRRQRKQTTANRWEHPDAKKNNRRRWAHCTLVVHWPAENDNEDGRDREPEEGQDGRRELFMSDDRFIRRFVYFFHFFIFYLRRSIRNLVRIKMGQRRKSKTHTHTDTHKHTHRNETLIYVVMMAIHFSKVQLLAKFWLRLDSRSHSTTRFEWPFRPFSRSIREQ